MRGNERMGDWVTGKRYISVQEEKMYSLIILLSSLNVISFNFVKIYHLNFLLTV